MDLIYPRPTLTQDVVVILAGDRDGSSCVSMRGEGLFSCEKCETRSDSVGDSACSELWPSSTFRTDTRKETISFYTIRK